MSTLIIPLLLTSVLHSVHASVTVGGGDQTSEYYAKKTLDILQDKKNPYATELDFDLDSDACVEGWKATIGDFSSADSEQNGAYAAHFHAYEGSVAFNEYCTVSGTLWLENQNSAGIHDWIWSASVGERCVLNHIWSVGYPYEDPLTPGSYLHRLTITNKELTEPLDFIGLQYRIDMTKFDDLKTISFTGPSNNFQLVAGASWTIDIPTLGEYYGGHIYFKYSIERGAGNVVLRGWADHPVNPQPPTVGGIVSFVDKLGLLAPYIGLASTIAIAAVSIVAYVKLVKHRKEKQ